MKRLIALLIFFLGPIVGVVTGLAFAQPDMIDLENSKLYLDKDKLSSEISFLDNYINDFQKDLGIIQYSIEEQQKKFQLQKELLTKLVEKSKEQKELSDEIYEKRILKKLGTPFDMFISDNIQVMLFELNKNDYRGYIAKLKLYDSDSIKVVIAKDELGESETTLEAVKRTGGIMGINGGGFYKTSINGETRTLPMGNTMIKGELMGSFKPSWDNVFFMGITKEGDLLGDTYDEKSEMMIENPWQGVSFVPVLLKDRLPRNIPAKWKHTQHPRTVIGQYANGDIILIVIDGRQPGWSNGISLEELQILLMEYGVVDAFNLDGGGSSTFVYNNEVLNRPSDGKLRALATNIIVVP
jgi:exopolysaccharide biosynthesis protein